MSTKNIKFQLFFLLTLLFFAENSFGQTPNFEWYKTIYNSSGQKKNQVIRDIAVSKIDGAVFIVGSCEGNNSDSLGLINFSSTVGRAGFMAKYTKNGAFLWSWKIDGSGDEEVSSIALNNVDEIVIGGYFTTSLKFYNKAGTNVYSETDIDGVRNAFVVKIRTNGTNLTGYDNTTQLFQSAPSFSCEVSDISIDSLNRAYVAINYNFFIKNNVNNPVIPFIARAATGKDAVVLIYSASSTIFAVNTLAYRIFKGIGNESITAITSYLDTLYVVGNTTSDTIRSEYSLFFNPAFSATFPGSNNNIFIAKFSNFLLNTSMQSSHNDKKQYVSDVKCVHGKLYLTGALKIGSVPARFLGPLAEPAALLLTTSDSTTKAFLGKYNSNFVAEWVRTLGQDSTRSLGRQLDVDSYSNIFLVGKVEGKFLYKSNDDNNFFYNTPRIVSTYNLQDSIKTTRADGFISKFDKNGNQLWMQILGSIIDDDAEGTVVKRNGNSLFFGGQFNKKFTISFNNTNVEVKGNQNIQNIIFGRINSCLQQGGKIISIPVNICTDEPYMLVAKDYFGKIVQWEKINADSSIVTFIANTSDTLFANIDSTDQYFRFLIDEGDGCPTLYSNKIAIDPLPKPQPFNLIPIYPLNETDSIAINHSDTFDNTINYLWETSLDEIYWDSVSTDFNYYYPSLPDSFVYIRRTARNPFCNNVSSIVTKIIRENTGYIKLLSSYCDLFGDSIPIKLQLDSASTNFNVLGWERDINDGFGFLNIPNTDSLIAIEDYITDKTIYRVKLQHITGGIFYTDTMSVKNIPFPNALLNQTSKSFCVGEVGLEIMGANENSNGYFTFNWIVTTLMNSVIVLDTTTTVDTLIFNHSFPNDSVSVKRIITVIGCDSLNFKKASEVKFTALISEGGNLLNANSQDASVICKNSDLDLHLSNHVGDSIRWGFSYDGINISDISTFTNSDSVTFTYESTGDYTLRDSFLDILDIPFVDSLQLYIFAIENNASCAADTSTWFKITIATRPDDFGFTNDSIIFCTSNSGNLEVFTDADLNSINWNLINSGGFLSSATGSTNSLIVYNQNTSVDVEAVFPDTNGCIFADTINVLWSILPNISSSPDTNILCTDGFEIEGLDSLPYWFSESFSYNGIEILPVSVLGDSFSFSGFNYGFGVFKNTITDSKCGTDISQIYNVYRPLPPNAGADISYCNTTQIDLESPNAENGQWTYIDSNLVNDPTISTPNNNTTIVTNMEIGNYYFVWTGSLLTNGGCPNNSDTVCIKNVYNSSIGAIQSNDDDNQFCSENSGVTMWCLAENTDSIFWEITDVATNNVNIIGNNDTIVINIISANSVVRLGTYSLTCGANYSDTIHLTIADPSIGWISGEDTLCSNNVQDVALTVVNAVGEINWLQSVDAINYMPVGNVNQSTLLVGSISETTFIQAYTTLNGCNSEPVDFQITFVSVNSPSLIVADTICYSSNAIDMNTFLDQPTNGTWNINNGILIPADYGGSTVTIAFTTAVCPEIISANIYITPAANTDTIFLNECKSSILIFNPNLNSGSWNIPNEINYVENAVSGSFTFYSLVAGSYSAAIDYITLSGGCENKYNYNLTFNPIDSIANAGNDIILDNLYTTELNAVAPIYGTGSWSVISGGGNFTVSDSGSTVVENLHEGNNILLWTIENGDCKVMDEMTITVNGLLIPTGFSPDGDGVNDRFVIRGLNLEMNTSLMVFNTMGQTVFEDTNYKNNWSGLDNRGKELSNDTYYIILKFENLKEHKGYVIIKK